MELPRSSPDFVLETGASNATQNARPALLVTQKRTIYLKLEDCDSTGGPIERQGAAVEGPFARPRNPLTCTVLLELKDAVPFRSVDLPLADRIHNGRSRPWNRGRKRTGFRWAAWVRGLLWEDAGSRRFRFASLRLGHPLYIIIGSLGRHGFPLLRTLPLG